MVNLISGGLHAGWNLDFQDFLALPISAPTYSDALEMVVRIYRALADVLRRHGHEPVLVGDEGGFGPKLSSGAEAVELILEALSACGYTPGRDVALGIDVAASHFYRDGQYRLRLAGGEPVTGHDLVELLARWTRGYPILSIEDALAEDDWAGWHDLTRHLGDRLQLIGDDLFATSPERLRSGIARGVANSILIKPNQIGTLTETFACIRIARDAGYLTVISARSGETEDSTIADLAVATAAGQIKIGSVARSERLAKYNQLLRIEDYLGPRAQYIGAAVFDRFRR